MDWLAEMALRYPRRFMIAAGALMLVVGVIAWWQFVWQNPANVFTDMLAANLATTSVTKAIVAGDDKQGVNETIRLQMGSTNAAEWLVRATQSGARVSTDSVGTPTTGYLRYTDIKSGGNKPTSFASVLNVWAQSDGKTDASLGQLFSSTVLDISNAPIPPIGNLSAKQRETLLQFARDANVFTPDYTHVTQKTVVGRSVYEYAVSVRLAGYARLMQAFAHDVGYTTLDQIDPNQYIGTKPVTVTMDVDPFSHQLVRVVYAGGFSQTYSDWGLLTDITVPSHSISTTALQERLQSLGKS